MALPRVDIDKVEREYRKTANGWIGWEWPHDPNSDECIGAFEEEYRDAADELADELGIQSHIATDPQDRYYRGSSTEEGSDLWQAIHDRMVFPDVCRERR